MRYQITHRTEYRYEAEVTASHGQTHLLPRAAPGQECRASAVTIAPVPDDRRGRIDYFGNRCLAFSILEPHTTLTVVATSTVDVAGAPTAPLLADQPWEVARDRLAGDADPEIVAAREMVLASPRVPWSPALHAYAAPSLAPGRALLEAALDLCHRIHDDFAYVPGATTVRTGVEEALAAREGVCQDFAHVAIGCLRAHGLAARYVSGYLETDPPPGGAKLQGSDASHAWLAVFVPGGGWVGLDPTNDQVVGARHVTTAWGRDYDDVAPLEGIIFTDGTRHDLDVSVDVVRLRADPPS